MRWCQLERDHLFSCSLLMFTFLAAVPDIFGSATSATMSATATFIDRKWYIYFCHNPICLYSVVLDSHIAVTCVNLRYFLFSCWISLRHITSVGSLLYILSLASTLWHCQFFILVSYAEWFTMGPRQCIQEIQVYCDSAYRKSRYTVHVWQNVHFTFPATVPDIFGSATSATTSTTATSIDCKWYIFLAIIQYVHTV